MIKPCRITKEELAWTENQPLIGPPSLPRSRAALTVEGLFPEEMNLVDDTLTLRLRREGMARKLDFELTQRLLISVLRRSGFDVGFTEAGPYELTDEFVLVSSFTASIGEVAAGRAPQVEQ